MRVALTNEARARLDAHLDAVEQALIQVGNTRDQRRGVVDDLEAQVLDMLAARTAAPGLADVEAVLGVLDPTEAYGTTANVMAPETVARETASAPREYKRAMETSVPTNVKRRKFMKSSVLIALVICGTLLVMTPAIADYLNQRNFVVYAASLASMTKTPDGLQLHFDAQPMEGVYRFGFWFTGSVAIGFAIIGGFIAFARDSKRGQ